MAPAEVDGKKAVRFTEQGQGQMSPHPQPVHATLEATWLAVDGFHPLDFQKTVKNLGGAAVVTESKHFDVVKGTVTFTREFPNGPTETKSISTPQDTLAA